jgi:hypothetical protein
MTHPLPMLKMRPHMVRMLCTFEGLDKEVVMKPVNARLQLETLEGRDCPSATLSLLNGGQTLVIKGDAGNDSISIVQNDANDTLIVSMTGMVTGEQNGMAKRGKQVFKSSQITQIVIDTGAGNDTVSYELGANANFRFGKIFNINLGSGDDVLQFETGNQVMAAMGSIASVSGSSDTSTSPRVTSANLAVESFLKLTVDAGSGNDQVTINLSELRKRANVAVSAQLGDGDDTFSLVSAGPIRSGSTLRVDVDGGTGNDSIYTSIRGTVEAGAFAGITVRGSQGDDQLTTDFAALLLGKSQLKLLGGQGDDQVHITGALPAGSLGTVLVQAYGEQGDDVMDCNFWPAPETHVDASHSIISGGEGNDKAMLAFSVATDSVETVEFLAQSPNPENH